MRQSNFVPSLTTRGQKLLSLIQTLLPKQNGNNQLLAQEEQEFYFLHELHYFISTIQVDMKIMSVQAVGKP